MGEGCVSGLLALLKTRRRVQPSAFSTSSSSSVGKRTVRVAVKVVHPQVRRTTDVDLRVLHLIAWSADAFGFESLGLSLMLRQFAAFLQAQTDLREEAKSLGTFRDKVGSDPNASVVVPEVFQEWVTCDVLVMSFEDGQPLSALLHSDEASFGCERSEAWRILVDLFWAMVFKYRFVHGDMHPGNLLWRRRMGSDTVQLVLLDCGLVIDLNGDVGDDLSMMVKAFFAKTPEETAALLITLSERVGGKTEDVVEPQEFVRGIAGLIRTGRGVGFRLSRLNAGELMGKSMLLGRRHCVRFDARFVNLMVAMVVLQGVALQLKGDGDILSPMMPHVFGVAIGAGGLGGILRAAESPPEDGITRTNSTALRGRECCQ